MGMAPKYPDWNKGSVSVSPVRRILSLMINGYLAISTIVIFVLYFFSAGQVDTELFGFHGTQNLIFYTVDSNILMSLCGIFMIVFLLRRKERLARPWSLFILASAVSVSVTFVTVALFLAPGMAHSGRGYFTLFQDDNLFFHFLNPVLGCVDFIWFIPHRKFTVRECFFGIIPTAVYAVVYVLNVVILETWPDIYNFTFGGHKGLAPVVVLVMLALAFAIALLLTRLHNRAGRHH